MMKKTLLMLFVSVGFLLSSCVKDEAKNMECDIESAWVEGEEYASNFLDPTQMRIENISSTEVNIVFTVRSLISLPKELPVFFKVTPGATVEPASGSLQNFKEGPVAYTVTSEDGQWRRSYRVAFREPSLPTSLFTYEMVDTVVGNSANKSTMCVFYDLDQKGEKVYHWASGNTGFGIVQSMYATPDTYPTYSINEGYKNKGVCMQTLSAGEMGVWMKKPIAAGNLFLGKFIAERVVLNPLKATQFGIQMDREPVRVTGFYKYQPGKVFTNYLMEEIPGRVDEASIYAVFYRNKDADGNPYFLYGDDVETDEKLLNNPQVYKIARVASLPPTNEWTPFEMFFHGKDADDELVHKNEFNLALVFSSSKGGAQFEGAIGSKLYIDEVELSFEK